MYVMSPRLAAVRRLPATALRSRGMTRDGLLFGVAAPRWSASWRTAQLAVARLGGARRVSFWVGCRMVGCFATPTTQSGCASAVLLSPLELGCPVLSSFQAQAPPTGVRCTPRHGGPTKAERCGTRVCGCKRTPSAGVVRLCSNATWSTPPCTWRRPALSGAVFC